MHKKTYVRYGQLIGGVACVLVLFHVTAVWWDEALDTSYQSLASRVVYDRNGSILQVELNTREQLCLFAHSYPDTIVNLVLAKEDQWFYYHPGIHPPRIALALLNRLRGESSGGASTVTQQLAKILLGTSGERTLGNKVREAAAALVLEYRHDKDTLLSRYLNVVPLGGNIQGFPAAARAYFNKPVHALSESEVLQLVAALSNPADARPLSKTNLGRAQVLAAALETPSPLRGSGTERQHGASSWLELADLQKDCPSCTSTIDADLNERIRGLLSLHVERGRPDGFSHGAVVVMDVPTGELIALVGSPDPESSRAGNRINMALATRPIGSTIKPFLYLLGFMQGLRPYTRVEDREYRYALESGFPLYPKNYDGQYRGVVTLEEALANSLNVPTVSVLRYITLQTAYEYFDRTLGFAPAQGWESYAYGIALGGLELDLVTLTHAFSALARGGTLGPLIVGYTPESEPHAFVPPHSHVSAARTIAPPDMVSLVNAILSDRTAGVEQFGQKGNLHLTRGGYAVKTGTSRDYHDSWTVGYTGDFVVGVWAGNTDNHPMRGVSGSSGAGALWHDVMELMFTTSYHQDTSVPVSGIVTTASERGYSYALPQDDVDDTRDLLMDDAVILFPHDHDVFLFTPLMRLPLETATPVSWTLNDTTLIPERGAWYPTAPGTYELTAIAGDGRSETVSITIAEEPTTFP